MTTLASASTVYGNAGKSWCNLSNIRNKQATASIGCLSYGKSIAQVNYVISYTGGAYSSDYGIGFAASKQWSTVKVPEFRSSGVKTATFSGSGQYWSGGYFAIANPSGAAYVTD